MRASYIKVFAAEESQLARNESGIRVPGRDSTARSANDFVESFARGLSVIGAFGTDRADMTLSQVADVAGLTRANARRLLLTLVQLGFAEQDGRLFRLRPKILDLGYAYLSSTGFAHLAQPGMEQLARRVNLSTSLSVLDGTDIIYIARVAVRGSMDMALGIGRRLPAHLTAMGRVLLGGLSEEQLSRYLARAEWVRATSRSVVDATRMRQVVAADRRRGWSHVDQQLEDYTYSMAVPVNGRGGQMVAALAVGGVGTPARRDLERDLLPLLRDAARELSELADKSLFKPPGWILESVDRPLRPITHHKDAVRHVDATHSSRTR